MSISKFKEFDGTIAHGRGLNVNDFYKLHTELDQIKTQVKSDKKDPNVTDGTWLKTKEKLLSLKCRYDILMAANHNFASRPLIDRASELKNSTKEQTQTSQLATAQPEVEKNENPKIDFGVLIKYEKIAHKVDFIIACREMKRPDRLSFQKAAAIFLEWYPAFRCDFEFALVLTKEIPLLQELLTKEFLDNMSFQELICLSYETDKMSQLLGPKEISCLRDYNTLLNTLNIVILGLNTKLADRMSAFGGINFTQFVEDTLEELGREAKLLYWINSGDSLGCALVNLERCIARHKLCCDLMQEHFLSGELKTQLHKIGNRLCFTIKKTLPYLLQEQMRLKAEEAQKLTDDSPDMQKLKTLMKDLDADTFEDLIKNFYTRYGFFGAHGASYLESGSPKAIESPPLKAITYFKDGEQEAQKISLQIRSFNGREVGSDAVDPRLVKKAQRMRGEALRGMLKMDDIKNCQVFLQEYFKTNLSKATRKAAIQLSYDTNMHYLALLQKEPLALESDPKIKSIEALILEREEFSPEENRESLRIVQEMVVTYFLTQVCCLSLDGLDRSFPYLPPSGDMRPFLSTLSGLETPKLSNFVQHAYQQMSYNYDLDYCKADSLDPFFKHAIGVKLLDPENGDNAVQHLQKLDSKTLGFNELRGSLKAYLEEVRKHQLEGKLGNIGFYIQVSGQGGEYHLAMNLQIAEGDLAEINLLNPYNHDEEIITCSSTKQLCDYILPGTIQALTGGSNNGAPLKVSFTPFCSKKQYELFCSTRKQQQNAPAKIAPASIAANRPEYTKVIEFPREIYGDNIVTVRGNISGVLNWDDNPPLTIRNGNYVFEIPRAQYAEQEYKFVLLVPGREPIWEDLQGNRKLSDNRSELPIFKY
jgi:hypothetical protein